MAGAVQRLVKGFRPGSKSDFGENELVLNNAKNVSTDDWTVPALLFNR